MADKKNMAKADKPMTKTGFIKSFGPDASADEIVAKGKDAGLEITKKYVWTLRSEMRAGGTKKTSKPIKGKRTFKVAASKGAKAPSAAPAASAKAKPASNAEQQLKALVIELGTVRAEEIYRSVRKQLDAIMAP